MVGTMPLHPLLQLLADQGKVAQVVRNLLSNALKFTERNGTVRVKVSAEDDATATATATGFDAEGMLPRNKTWRSFFHRSSSGLFSRSSKTHSALTLMVAKCLVIEVVDSGLGISSVTCTRCYGTVSSGHNVCCIVHSLRRGS